MSRGSAVGASKARRLTAVAAADMAAMEDDADTWIGWFCSQKGNEFLCEVEASFIGAPTAAWLLPQRVRPGRSLRLARSHACPRPGVPCLHDPESVLSVLAMRQALRPVPGQCGVAIVVSS